MLKNIDGFVINIKPKKHKQIAIPLTNVNFSPRRNGPHKATQTVHIINIIEATDNGILRIATVYE